MTEAQFLQETIADLRQRAEQARSEAPRRAALPPKGDPARDVWYHLSTVANRLEHRLREIGGAA